MLSLHLRGTESFDLPGHAMLERALGNSHLDAARPLHDPSAATDSGRAVRGDELAAGEGEYVAQGIGDRDDEAIRDRGADRGRDEDAEPPVVVDLERGHVP